MFFNSLLFLALGRIALAAVCNDKQVVHTDEITTDSGHTLKVQSYSCSNNVHSDLEPAGQLAKRDEAEVLSKRDARCTTTTAPCLCGVPCIFNACRAETQSIRETDCNTLITSLQTNSGTFTIQFGDAVGFIFESCEYTLFATLGTQYCFSDMGNAAAEMLAVCGTTQQASCKMVSGPLTAFVDQISL
ncbi:hypothetical protein CPC08DRAFT_715705 [Agrocybe pediades]|nr:hypothetical protein CPC08DRAFT_715705 [Agrocybe pediades]